MGGEYTKEQKRVLRKVDQIRREWRKLGVKEEEVRFMEAFWQQQSLSEIRTAEIVDLQMAKN